jgi:hypothetical protein
VSPLRSTPVTWGPDPAGPGPQVDHGAALDGLIFAVLIKREPARNALDGVDDHDLVDAVGGVERQLVPTLIAGGEDLRGEGRGVKPPAGAFAVKPGVGDPVVVEVLAEVELIGLVIQVGHRREVDERRR